VAEQQETIGGHPTWNLPVLGSVHSDTIWITWVAMAVTLVLLFLATRVYSPTRVTKRQTFMELLVGFLENLAVDTLGPAGRPFVPLTIAIFTFILVLNEIGLVPWPGRSPTSDLNTTAGMALFVFIMLYVVGIKNHGIKYFKHWLGPKELGPIGMVALIPINLIEDFTKPVTLAMRLFGNILAGEILLFVVATIIASHLVIGPLNISAGATIAPFLIYGFNLFVGLIQALVFTLLTVAYLMTPTSEEGSH